jgi:hypothetical protein
VRTEIYGELVSPRPVYQPVRRRERDTQRSKVYAWERSEFGWDKEVMSLEQCQALARSIRPGVWAGDGCGRRAACAVPQENVIKLPKWARTKWVVLHEVAHLIAWDGRRAAHGREFMAEYLDLLATHYKRDKDLLWASALAAGLRVGY